MRKLEQIYERQLNIEDKRRQEEEKIEMEREESEQQRWVKRCDALWRMCG